MKTTSKVEFRFAISFYSFIGAAAFITWLLLRLILWAFSGEGNLSASELLTALGTGVWFDLWTLSYCLAPVLLLSAAIPDRWRKKPTTHAIKWILAWPVISILLFASVSEFIFWQEFSTRFNFIAVDYLIYTNEVIGNIRESYPVAQILLAIGASSWLLVSLARKHIRFEDKPYTPARRIALLCFAILLPLASYGAAEIDQMQITGNAYANELAGNGLFSLAAAMRRNDLDYDKFYKTIPQAEANRILASDGVSRTPLLQPHRLTGKNNLPAQQELGGFTRKPRNIVLITVESLSAEYLGAYGGRKQLTPYLDKIAAEGLVFDRVFAIGTRTVRGLEALSLGIPPIPGQAVIHRQNIDHLATIGEVLEAQGYSTFFLYGGYGYFDNMNAYFRANDYTVIDRTDFSQNEITAENVWGVDDESLLNHALGTLDSAYTSKKPFFAHLMTTSNHRPYTFPQGRIDLPQGNRSGAVKYTDYAIGKFIEHAHTKPWFKDTLFVIVADHCASVAGKTKLPVAKYHIPLIFYAPDMLKSGHENRLASQIDIVPTLLDLLGEKGGDLFFGKSIFQAEKNGTTPRAFISNYQELGYYKDDSLIVLSPKQKVESYKINPRTFEATPFEPNRQLVAEAISYYQTASRAFKFGALKEFPDIKQAASMYLY